MNFIADLKTYTQFIQNYLLDLVSHREAVSAFNEEEKTQMTDRYNCEVIHKKLLIEDLVLLHQKETAKLKAH